MAGEIVHLELKSSDFARSSAFYEKLFGWRTDGVQSGGHLMFETPAGDAGAHAVQGSWIRAALAQAPGPVPFIAVDDLDAVLAGAEQEGGTVLVRRLSLGTRGVFGLIADPDGNVVGVLAHRAAAVAAGAAPAATGGKLASPAPAAAAAAAAEGSASSGKRPAAPKAPKPAAKKPVAAKRPAKRSG
jgi:predicted enzyme related to lactoylglutathione lyase